MAPQKAPTCLNKDSVRDWLSNPSASDGANQYKHIFGWDESEMSEAKQYTVQCLRQAVGDDRTRMPTLSNDSGRKLRRKAEKLMMTGEKRHLFRPYWLREKQPDGFQTPGWYRPDMFYSANRESGSIPQGESTALWTVTIAFHICANRSSAGVKRETGEDDDGNDDKKDDAEAAGSRTPKSPKPKPNASGKRKRTAQDTDGPDKKKNKPSTPAPTIYFPPRPAKDDTNMIVYFALLARSGNIVRISAARKVLASGDLFVTRSMDEMLRGLAHNIQVDMEDWSLFSWCHKPNLSMKASLIDGDRELQMALIEQHEAWDSYSSIGRQGYMMFFANDVATLDELPYANLNLANLLQGKSTTVDLDKVKRDTDQIELDEELARRIQAQQQEEDDREEAKRVQAKLDAIRESNAAGKNGDNAETPGETPAPNTSAKTDNHVGANQDTPIDLTIDGSVQPAQQPPQPELFPYTIIPTTPLSIRSAGDVTIPYTQSGPIADNCKVEYVEWLSTCPEGSKALEQKSVGDALDAVTDLEDDALIASVSSDAHITQGNWLRHSAFMHADPRQCVDPRTKIVWDGWAEKKALPLYQLNTTCWSLARITEGRDLVVVALDTGLGKSVILTAMIDILRRVMRHTCRKGVKTITGPPTSASTHRVLWDNSPYTADLATVPLKDAAGHFDLRKLLDPGMPAKIRHGINLVLCTPAMPKTLAKESWDAYDPAGGTRRPVIVLMEKKAPTWLKDARAEGTFTNVFLIEEYIRTDDPCFPEGDSILKCFTDDDTGRPHEEISIRELMRSQLVDPATSTDAGEIAEDIGRPASWHGDIVAICNMKNVNLWFPSYDFARDTVANELRGDRVDCVIGHLYIDEYHNAPSTGTAAADCISGLPGNPAITCFSATPPHLPAGALKATSYAYSRYYSRNVLAGKPTSACSSSLKDWRPYDHLTRKGMKPEVTLTPAQRRLLARWSYVGKGEAFQHANSLGTDNQTLSVGTTKDQLQGTTVEASDLNEKQIGSLRAFGEWTREYQITVRSDTIWNVQGTAGGEWAVELPPHSHWDMKVPIPLQYQPQVREIWDDKMAKVGAMKSKYSVLTSLGMFAVLCTFPCLPQCRQDPEFDAFCVGSDNVEYGVKAADKIAKTVQSDVLDRHMMTIHQLPNIKAFVEGFTAMEATPNGYGKIRKQLCVCEKPFNAGMLDYYMRWGRRTGNIPCITDADDGFFIPSSTFTVKLNTEKKLEEFCAAGLRPAYEEYNDKPWYIVGVGSRVREGLSLQPADVVWILDTTFKPAHLYQVRARVSRATVVQHNKKTFSIRVLTEDDHVLYVDWSNARGLNLGKMQEYSAKVKKK